MASENRQSAKYLQARINTLITTLQKRFENIIAASSNTYSHQPTHPDVSSTDTSQPTPYVDAAAEQVQMEVESSALVRAAEDIMLLTRELKDLWLFGGLDTLKEGDSEAKEDDMKMQEDIRIVSEAVKRYFESQRLQERSRSNSGTGEGKNAVEMDMKS